MNRELNLMEGDQCSEYKKVVHVIFCKHKSATTAHIFTLCLRNQ